MKRSLIIAMAGVWVTLLLAGCDGNAKGKQKTHNTTRNNAQDAGIYNNTPLAAIDVIPGEWELEYKMEMMGEAVEPHITSTFCVDKQDLLDPVYGKTETHQCKPVNMQVKGNTVEWDLVCTRGVARYVVTYTPKSFKGRMDTWLEADKKNEPSVLGGIVTGKYVGECKDVTGK